MRHAEAWYARASPAAANRLRDELRQAFEYIGAHPFGAHVFEGDFRAKSLSRFPFSILYIVLPDRVRVVAIADERRNPGTYDSRFRD